MMLALAFALLSSICLALAAFAGVKGIILLWPAVAFGVVAYAYKANNPGLLGKRTDTGDIDVVLKLLLLPFFGLTWGSWHILRATSKEDACNQILSGLWIGRRPNARELPEDVELIIDLTAEFEPARDIEFDDYRRYHCLPMLDASAAHPEAFRDLVLQVANDPPIGSVYVHCAQGHGRSAAFVAAVLIARDIAVDVEEAMGIISAKRPGVGLAPDQIAFLSRLDLRPR